MSLWQAQCGSISPPLPPELIDLSLSFTLMSMGPLPVRTHSGYRYWSTWIDDYGSFKVVIPMKAMSETFDAFKRFKAYAETQLDLRIAALQDDKGAEYMSKEFEQFCIEHGIARRHTVRNRPQQNGVAERFNRTLGEGITTMLQEAGLPPSFWGEALASLVYILNRVPTSLTPDATPFEWWLKCKPDL